MDLSSIANRTLGALKLPFLIAGAPYWLRAPPVADVGLTGELRKDNKLQIKELERSYHVYVPNNLQPGAALLIALHGTGQTGLVLRDWSQTRFDQLADEKGFVVVYADGVNKSWSDHTKNRGYDPALRAKIDELAFIKQLIATMAKQHGSSTERVFAVGYSNGGGLVTHLVMQEPSLFKAAAIYSAQLPTDDNRLSSAPTHRELPPLVLFAGTADTTVPYRGGEMLIAGVISRGYCVSFDKTVAELVRHSKVKDVKPYSEDIAVSSGPVKRIKKTTYATDGTAQLTAYEMEGGGHTIALKGQRYGVRLLGATADFDSPGTCIEFFGLSIYRLMSRLCETATCSHIEQLLMMSLRTALRLYSRSLPRAAVSRRSLASARDDPPATKPSPATDPWGLPLQTMRDESPEDAQAAIEPHPQDRPRQANEDIKTLRARLVYQTRKRGTLETGLLLSTFATVERLNKMNEEELQELDRLLCVPEWTLYYWSIGRQHPPEDSPFAKSKLLDDLRAHSANKEGKTRSMPELPN